MLIYGWIVDAGRALYCSGVVLEICTINDTITTSAGVYQWYDRKQIGVPVEMTLNEGVGDEAWYE